MVCVCFLGQRTVMRLFLQVVNPFLTTLLPFSCNSSHRHVNSSFLLQLVVPEHQLKRTVHLALSQERCCIQLSMQPRI